MTGAGRLVGFDVFHVICSVMKQFPRPQSISRLFGVLLLVLWTGICRWEDSLGIVRGVQGFQPRISSASFSRPKNIMIHGLDGARPSSKRNRFHIPDPCLTIQPLHFSSLEGKSVILRSMSHQANHKEPSISRNDDANLSLVRQQQIQACLLIAGTTVGGGFLALPTSVVVPVGGFVPAATSLLAVWMYLLVTSLLLTQCLVHSYHTTTRTDTNTSNVKDASSVVLGIPRVAQLTLGRRGSVAATVLLVVLTEATLVSQLSCAGSLWADSRTGSSSSMTQYRLGGLMAAAVGALVSLWGGSGGGNETMLSTSETTSSLATTTASSTKTSQNVATTVNSILTIVFLIFVALLFQAGQSMAIWSRCLPTTQSSFWPVSLATVRPMLRAVPVMLQLLVYGEILPHVCHLLDYNMSRIRTSVVVGSILPLGLLTGWAALGTALVPPTAAVTQDPVKILLTSNGGSTTNTVARRLLVLSVSAIGTTILGSFLALKSAYDDVVTLLRATPQGKSSASSSPLRLLQLVQSRFQRPWFAPLLIAMPPTLISIISPSIFLQAIDFAGSYPILLLYGVIPPLMALYQQQQEESKEGSTTTSTHNNKRRRRRRYYVSIAVLSGSMCVENAIVDLRFILRLLWSKFARYK